MVLLTKYQFLMPYLAPYNIFFSSNLPLERIGIVLIFQFCKGMQRIINHNTVISLSCIIVQVFSDVLFHKYSCSILLDAEYVKDLGKQIDWNQNYRIRRHDKNNLFQPSVMCRKIIKSSLKAGCPILSVQLLKAPKLHR